MEESVNSKSMLKVGTILRGMYRIDSYLSSGGFGNTYVATNIEFEEKVAIKEFFMKGVSERDDNQTTVSVSNLENNNSFLEQKEKFKKEARRLRKLKNEHIVKVHDLFEENGTAYYVMDYVDGENLAERLKRTGRSMTESEVRLILPQILDALKAVHDAGIWHLDLKPANILLEKGGNVKLIDFGASKQLNVQKGGATTSTAISYTNGYAPREQMEQNYDKFGPWTDIYALGATLYNLLTNKRPPLPTDIDDDISEDKHFALPMSADISDGMKKLVMWLMKTNRMQRPESIDDLTSKMSSSSWAYSSIKVAKETIVVEPSSPSSNNGNDVDSEETIIEVPKRPKTNNEQESKSGLGHVSEQSTYNQSDNLSSNVNDTKIIKTEHIVFIGIISIILLLIFLGYQNNRSESFIKSSGLEKHKIYGYGKIDVYYDWGSGIYEGELKDEKPDGHGTITYYDGKYKGYKFVGEFKDGEANGQGKLTSSNGEVIFEGIFSQGHRWNGQGKEENVRPYYAEDGKLIRDTFEYVGGFKNGLRDGKGTIKWRRSGEQYIGDFIGGERTGYGVLTINEKRNGHSYKYEGEFLNGEFHGEGTLYFNEKRNGYAYKYVGGFQNNEFHGDGTWYYVGGGLEKHKYEKGKQIK